MIKYTILDGTTIEGSVGEVWNFITRMSAVTLHSSNNEIEIYGQPFEKVKEPARKGDFIVYETAPFGFLTANFPYLVSYIDGDGAIIEDDDGDEYGTHGDDFIIYRIKGKE
ncbi:TPA: hypothetical protein MMD81_002086 [Listeria monocytogenes]|nr:hypothetical protein [Listeria monocytogenes]HBZ6462227.1 hypothetical protein [Listeria monocytogenes]